MLALMVLSSVGGLDRKDQCNLKVILYLLYLAKISLFPSKQTAVKALQEGNDNKCARNKWP